MSFLWPGTLVLLAAAGIPVLIHLLGEQRYEKVYFSSIRLLKQIETDSLRKIRLRQWIILILRTLGILFLVMALAGPFAGEWRLGGPGEGLILVDYSPSSRFHRDFETIVNILQSEFPGWDTLRVYEKMPPQTLTQKLPRTRPPEHLFFLTDLQANEAMPVFLSNLRNHVNNPVILALNPFRERSWIQSLEIPARYFPAGDFIPVRAVLALPEDRHPLTYLTVNGKRVAQTRPDASGYVEFSFLAESPGHYHGMVKTEGSDHPFNQRYFSLKAGEKISILLVEGEDSYLLPALEALFTVDVESVMPDHFPGSPLENRDLLIVDGLHPFPKAQMARIRRFAQHKPVWIVMDRQPDPAWKEMLVLQDAREYKLSDGQFRITERAEAANPVFSELPGFSISRYFSIQADTPYQPLLRLNDGNPFLYTLRENYIYIQTSPFRLTDNQMGTHPLFTRTLKTVLFYFAGMTRQDIRIGEPIPIQQAGDEIIRPDGRRVKVLEPYTDTDIPGIYTRVNNGRQDHIAVNWPESETKNTVLESPLPGIRIIPAQTDEIRAFRETLKGKSLTPLFFLLTALCWGGELFLMVLNMKKRGKTKKYDRY
ncbi:MAG: hypothetical protein PWP06_752 [Candidatus Marinimicrobia bacterium]|jgi:hypothetical protein|nr:hypothetical protein [Candidatus Neomarinimicrobiota bacterium]